MDKHKLHHYWIRYRRITLIIPIVLLIVFSGTSIIALRSNNLKMLELKGAVAAADKENGDIEGSLQNLRNYVNSHMNTNMRSKDSTEPPIQLIYQFNRYVDQEQARITAQGSVNKVYLEAQQRCESGLIPLTARAQCIQDYVLQNGGSPQQLNLPPKELYTFDFASPIWTPDLAGISIVMSVIAGVVVIIRLVLGIYFNRILK